MKPKLTPSLSDLRLAASSDRDGSNGGPNRRMRRAAHSINRRLVKEWMALQLSGAHGMPTEKSQPEEQKNQPSQQEKNPEGILGEVEEMTTCKTS